MENKIKTVKFSENILKPKNVKKKFLQHYNEFLTKKVIKFLSFKILKKIFDAKRYYDNTHTQFPLFLYY